MKSYVLVAEILIVLFNLECIFEWNVCYHSLNSNVLKDALIGTCTVTLRELEASRGYLDSYLPIMVSGRNYGTLHVTIAVPECIFSLFLNI